MSKARFSNNEERCMWAKRVLCANPLLSNAQLEVMQREWASRCKTNSHVDWHYYAMAREAIGIIGTNKKNKINLPVYQAACQELGITPDMESIANGTVPHPAQTLDHKNVSSNGYIARVISRRTNGIVRYRISGEMSKTTIKIVDCASKAEVMAIMGSMPVWRHVPIADPVLQNNESEPIAKGEVSQNPTEVIRIKTPESYIPTMKELLSEVRNRMEREYITAITISNGIIRITKTIIEQY